MLVIAVAIAIILPVDVAANNATANVTTEAPNYNTTTYLPTSTIGYNETNTTVSTNGTVNSTQPDNNNETVTTATSTTAGLESTVASQIQTTENASNATDAPTTSSPTSSLTTSSPTLATTDSSPSTLLITDIVQQNWSAVISATNFSGTVLAGFSASASDGTDFLDVVVEYYTSANQTQLQAFLEENRIDVVSSAILDNVTDALDQSMRQRFGTSSTSSLHGFYAFMHWMNDFVLVENSERFTSLLESHSSQSSGSANGTIDDFITHIISNASGSELLEAVCNAAESNGITQPQCSATAATPVENKVEKFSDHWQQVLTYNFSSLDDSEKQELESISSGNMTDALVTYVLNMSDEDIKKLLDANATAYVSSQLRATSTSLTEYLGQSIISALGNNATKQDVYFLYLNFMNGLISSAENFEQVLNEYLASANQTSNRRRKRSTGCDRSTINPDGLACHIVTVDAQNITHLATTVCGEFEESSACQSTFITDDTDSTPISSGVPIAAIVGGAVGGFLGLIVIIAVSCLIWRSCNKNQSKINPQEDNLSHNESNDMEMNAEPRMQGNGQGPNAARRLSDSS